MKKYLLLSILFISLLLNTRAQSNNPDTVYVGVFITSIHDIDFKQKEFTASFWLWMNYTNPKLDFEKNLEVPNAKTVEKTFFTKDTANGRIYVQMKLQCVMKDSWKISNFPFDEQKLRFSIENSQEEAGSMVFVADTLGEHYDKRFTLRDWKIDSCIITTGKKVYETAFGMSRPEQKSEYSNFRVRLSITRETTGLFWKMFLGMYLAFLISFICFFIHSDSMDSRFGLSVGALFAVIGNKYIIDSSLPESSSFTLVDLLHGLTLLFILIVILANSISLRMIKKDQLARAVRFDNRIAWIVLAIYILLNVFFIIDARLGLL